MEDTHQHNALMRHIRGFFVLALATTAVVIVVSSPVRAMLTVRDFAALADVYRASCTQDGTDSIRVHLAAISDTVALATELQNRFATGLDAASIAAIKSDADTWYANRLAALSSTDSSVSSLRAALAAQTLQAYEAREVARAQKAYRSATLYAMAAGPSYSARAFVIALQTSSQAGSDDRRMADAALSAH